MAHATERRTQLRGFYVYKRLPMVAACAAIGVPHTTGNRWKLAAKAKGDDWDKARAAQLLGDESQKQLMFSLLNDYVTLHRGMLDQLQAQEGLAEDKRLPLEVRAKLITSLTDGFVKMSASFKRLLPEINSLSVALDAMQRLATFTQEKYPQHVPALLEMLEPFGEELARAYG